jgi:hypothetical protein
MKLFNEWLKTKKEEYDPNDELRNPVGDFGGGMSSQERQGSLDKDNYDQMPIMLDDALNQVYSEHPLHKKIFNMIVYNNSSRMKHWWPEFKQDPVKWVRAKTKDWNKVRGPADAQEPSIWRQTADLLQNS